MKVIEGDIWDQQFDGYWRVIPTNIGWRKDGANVMGRGVARQASERNDGLAAWYGERCQNMAMLTQVDKSPYDESLLLTVYRPEMRDTDHLIMFPVKPLDKIQPHLSWKQTASYELIEASTRKLAEMTWDNDIVLPMVGCGNGGLSPATVYPVLKEHLTSDHFTLILEKSVYASFKYLGDQA